MLLVVELVADLAAQVVVAQLQVTAQFPELVHQGHVALTRHVHQLRNDKKLYTLCAEIKNGRPRIQTTVLSDPPKREFSLRNKNTTQNFLSRRPCSRTFKTRGENARANAFANGRRSKNTGKLVSGKK